MILEESLAGSPLVQIVWQRLQTRTLLESIVYRVQVRDSMWVLRIYALNSYVSYELQLRIRAHLQREIRTRN